MMGKDESVRLRRSSIVVVGSANVDLVVRTERHPAPGETLLGTQFSVHRGGKGANQAVAAARAGVSVVMIGRLGEDDYGSLLRAGLRFEGIDDRFVGTCRHDPTGVALITVVDSGENTIVVVPGANALLREVHIRDAAEADVFVDSAVVLAQLEVPLAAVRVAFEYGREHGARTILNAAPAMSVPLDVAILTDILIVNEHELQEMTGVSELNLALSAARATYPYVIATLGAAGARMIADGIDMTIPGHKPLVVDTTGAGDAFCGVFAASLCSGMTLDTALRRANAAGALATTVSGAQPSAPSETAVNAYLAKE